MQGPTVAQPYGALRAAGLKDGHHVIQDAAVRDLPGYDRNAAPAIRIDGPSTKKGTPHYNATQTQRRLDGTRGGTLGAETDIAGQSLKSAGLNQGQINQALKESQDYFNSIGADGGTITRTPRKQAVEFDMRDIPDRTRAQIVEVVKKVMAALVNRHTTILRPIFARSRVEADDAFRVIAEYGRPFSVAPPQAYEGISIIAIDNQQSSYSVDAYFWDTDSNQTDLSAEITIDILEYPVVYLDDIRVM